MKLFNILYFSLLLVIYFHPSLNYLVGIEGFWLWVIILWSAYFVSWFLIGDIADEIAGVNKYKDD